MSGNVKIIIIAVVALILVAAGVLVGMKFLGGGDEPSSEETITKDKSAETEAAKAEAEELDIYPLNTFVVNLVGSGGRRYLKVKITLEIPALEKGNIDKNLHKIRDSLLILLSNKTLENVMGAEGKYALREEVKVRLDRLLGKGLVRDIYFVEFVVQ